MLAAAFALFGKLRARCKPKWIRGITPTILVSVRRRQSSCHGPNSSYVKLGSPKEKLGGAKKRRGCSRNLLFTLTCDNTSIYTFLGYLLSQTVVRVTISTTIPKSNASDHLLSEYPPLGRCFRCDQFLPLDCLQVKHQGAISPCKIHNRK